jgi:DNA-binding MarR family transcriptional regulator
MSEISERFDISAAAASQLVDKLVHGGYLNRAEDPSDRRAKTLTLSPAGAALIKSGFDERYRWLGNIGASLSAQDQEIVSQALILLTNAAKEMDK